MTLLPLFQAYQCITWFYSLMNFLRQELASNLPEATQIVNQSQQGNPGFWLRGPFATLSLVTVTQTWFRQGLCASHHSRNSQNDPLFSAPHLACFLP